jgi:hypothetical protein
MPIALETLDVSGSLAEHQALLRHHEAQGYRLLSLAAAIMGGGAANVATFTQDPAVAEPPDAQLVLETVDGELSRDAQQGRLNGPARDIVCYGTLFVENQRQNVFAERR